MACARSLLLLISLTLVLLIPTIFAGDSNLANLKNESPSVHHLKHLHGCKKGQKTKGIKNVKKFLEHYGYLSSAHRGRKLSQANEDDFDDHLESAVKIYQTNFNISATGVLDAATVSHMMRPRCGFPDIINGTTRMRAGMKTNSSFHTVSHYSFLSSTWSKFDLTYDFAIYTREDAILAFMAALAEWESHSRFTFRYEDYVTADIRVDFFQGNHGCSRIFTPDYLAHAFPPESGLVHFNADQPWSLDVSEHHFHLETVALHELGHVLGLDHSSEVGAVMYPFIGLGEVNNKLTPDDILGLSALYMLH